MPSLVFLMICSQPPRCPSLPNTSQVLSSCRASYLLSLWQAVSGWLVWLVNPTPSGVSCRKENSFLCPVQLTAAYSPFHHLHCFSSNICDHLGWHPVGNCSILQLLVSQVLISSWTLLFLFYLNFIMERAPFYLKNTICPLPTASSTVSLP